MVGMGKWKRSSRREADQRHRERAATLTEYVLFLSIFVLVALGGVGALDRSAQIYFNRSADQIGSPRNHDRSAVVTTTTILGMGIGPTVPGAGGGSTTVAPTTSAVTATTIAGGGWGARRVSANIAAHSLSVSGGGFRVTLTSTGGAAVNGIRVVVERHRAGEVEQSVTCVTGPTGVCSSGTYAYERTGATWVVRNVVSAEWNGVVRSVSG